MKLGKGFTLRLLGASNKSFFDNKLWLKFCQAHVQPKLKYYFICSRCHFSFSQKLDQGIKSEQIEIESQITSSRSYLEEAAFTLSTVGEFLRIGILIFFKTPKTALLLSQQFCIRFVFKTNDRISSITSYKDLCCSFCTS